jgi:BTB/POZ domain-containing protein 3/6
LLNIVQAEMALRSEGFVDIDLHTLESVLARETLNCKEMALFDAALSWARAECARRELEVTAQNVRSVLGKALHLVRIPTMALEEFANGAAQQGVLTLKETIDIFLHFTAHNKPQLNYPTKPRTGLKPQVKSIIFILIIYFSVFFFFFFFFFILFYYFIIIIIFFASCS